MPRFLVVLLCAPWTQPVVVLARPTGLAHLYYLAFGHDFRVESPPLLFEPLWLVFCAVAATVNARLLTGVHRAATGLPYGGWWAAPLVAVGIPTAAWLFFRL
ncbi:hypothetical protein GCM10027160_05000 [Streptomyces calidiresistens]|uniref:Uncharacterized protein n=1 Tax=Streptomyces calidiresistens TaxID=1485586 RepID=A0A7W3T545_9ACTN|nr:hypothetical protein [Streptomyces calidiresistens]MBB0230846.1 hypothetical protein [Streptomyces calidiresistens]